MISSEIDVKILAVDDIPAKLSALTAILDEPGQTVVCAQSGRDALRRLLQDDLQVPSQATLWLGEEAVVRTVLRDLEGWIIRPATDGDSVPVVPMLTDRRPWAPRYRRSNSL